MARIELRPPRTLLYRAGEWYSKRRYGAVLDPAKVYAYNNKVLLAIVAVENLRSRINSAFGLKGQGFSDQCQIPSVS